MTQPIKILFMDDELAFASRMAGELRAHGYDVDTVSNARDAMEFANARAYDLAITDIIVRAEGRVVPDGGILLIHRLKGMPSNRADGKPIPIIALSGSMRNPGMQHILQTAEGVGADLSMEKPVLLEDLLEAVQQLTGV